MRNMPAEQQEDREQLATSTQPRNVATAFPAVVDSNSMSRRLFIFLPIALFAALYSHFNLQNALPNSESSSSTNQNEKASLETNIAVCYTGHVGTFEKVYKQNEQVFLSLNSSPSTSSKPISISYFFVVDLQDNYKDARTNRHYTHTHEIGTLQTIFEDIKFTASVETYTSADHKPSISSNCNNHNHKEEINNPIQDDAGHYLSSFSTLYANERCLRLIEQYEQNNLSKQFDWILRMRPDMEIDIKLPNIEEDTFKPRIHMSGFAMALIPRILSQAYFSAVHAFDEDICNDIKDMDDQICQNYSYDTDSSECLLIKWLKRSDIMPSNGLYVNRRIVYPK